MVYGLNFHVLNAGKTLPRNINSEKSNYFYVVFVQDHRKMNVNTFCCMLYV
jgi:hypothetical protein